jgi:hypothetical protein
MGVIAYLLPTSNGNYEYTETMYLALLPFIIIVLHEVEVDMVQPKNCLSSLK